MDEEVGETKAEREKWQQKRAILERAHIKDMMQLKEQQAELREDDIINFRAVLKEEHAKLKMVEDAWKGLLAGTHDAQLSYNTQRLSTVDTFLPSLHPFLSPFHISSASLSLSLPPSPKKGGRFVWSSFPTVNPTLPPDSSTRHCCILFFRLHVSG